MKQILKAMNIPTYYVPGFEADDVIGTIVERGLKEDINITIVSKDKDLSQLLTSDCSVNVFDPYKNKRTYIQEFIEKYNIKPEQFIDYLALVGDTSDNIPGVKGVGPKTAVTLLTDFNSIVGIYKAVEENKIKDSVSTKLIANEENCYLSEALATIQRDVPIEINFDDMQRKEMNCSELTSIFEELDFESLMGYLG
jgi:DNA polymerase-1